MIPACAQYQLRFYPTGYLGRPERCPWAIVDTTKAAAWRIVSRHATKDEALTARLAILLAQPGVQVSYR